MRMFWRLYVGAFVAILVVVSVLSYVLTARQLSDFEKHIVEENRIVVDLLAKQIEAGIMQNRWPFESLNKVSQSEDFLFWWIVRDDATMHLADKASFIGTRTDQYFPQINLTEFRGEVVLNQRENYGVYVYPISAGKKNWSFWLGFSLTRLMALKRSTVVTALTVHAGAMVVLGLILYLLISHYTQSVKHLAAGAAIIGKGDFTQRVSVDSVGELGELAQSFNAMATNLQQTTVSKTYLESILESMNETLIVLDRLGNVTSANKAVSAMLGYSPQELLGKPVSSLFPDSGEDLSQGTALIDTPINALPDNVETQILTKDGRGVPVLLGRAVIRDAHGTQAGAVITATDITRRVSAEKELLRAHDDLELKVQKRTAELRESEQSSRLLIEQAPIGIGIMQDGVITNVNPQFLKIFGYDSIHEVHGRPAEELCSPEDRVLITQWHKDRLSGKPVPMHYDVRGLKKNGESFDLSAWPTLVDYDGKPASLTFCVDTTESKSLRSQLLQSQKMEAIGTLAGGVAHDFNNLLQVVLGYSEILLNDKSSDHPDYDNLHKINSSARRGADLVQRLMVFSRKGDTKPRALNLNQEVTQIKKLLERTIPKMIAIELSMQGDLLVINADPVQVEQILLNLAINAKDAMPHEGGKLTIETRNVTLDEEYCRVHLEAKPGQYVMISVSDTGHGMSQETMQHIFEPFFTTKGVDKGTGLGLAMVYGIMKHHEGFINCYSELGHGTTFRLYFPVVSTEIEENSEQENEVPLGGSETILLVDDEEFLCDIGSQILTRAGYTVLTATNGKDALDLYGKERSDISLVILDLIMPEMGGKECFQELVNINPQVRVILSSGFLSNGTTEEATVLGIRGLVEKPFNMRQLLGLVREVLDGD